MRKTGAFTGLSAPALITISETIRRIRYTLIKSWLGRTMRLVKAQVRSPILGGTNEARYSTRGAAALLLLAGMPAAAYAQASITGVVRDTSGAVLPGVTVEVSSPVLIEKIADDRHRRVRAVPDHPAPPWHLHRHLHAARVQHHQARRHRAQRFVRRHRERRDAGRRAGGNHHRHRPDGARGRPERARPEGRHQGGRRRRADRPAGHQPRRAAAGHDPGRGRRRRPAPTRTR